MTPWLRAPQPPRWLLHLAAALAVLLLMAAFSPFMVPAQASAVETAASLVERGRWKEARAMIEPLAKANPDDVPTLILGSRVRAAFRDLDAAQELAERAVARDSKSAIGHEQLALVLGRQAQSAGALEQFGLARRFKKEADAAVALDPRRFEAQMALITFYIAAPGIVGGDKDKARARAEEIARLDPLQGELARSGYAAETHDSTAALAHARKATELGPEDYEARMTLANRLAVIRDSIGAEREALEAKRIDPGRSGAYVMLAVLYAHASRWSDLDAVLSAAQAEVPGNSGPKYQAARILVTENRELARAESYLRDYLAVEPEGGNPDHAAARWRLAQALEKRGRTREAIAELETAVKARPGFREAKKDLARLKKQG